MILKPEQVQMSIEGIHHAGRIGNRIPTAGAQVAESHEYLRTWHEATLPIIAALAIYGENASLSALVAKARELNEAPIEDVARKVARP